MVKIQFLVPPPFGLFCSVKYLNFEQKLPIRTARHIFLSRHSEVTKNPYYALSPKGSQKKVSTNGLILMCIGVYILYFKINPLTFCCPLLSRPLVQDQQNSKQTYCRLPIIISLWTPKGFSLQSLS